MQLCSANSCYDHKYKYSSLFKKNNLIQLLTQELCFLILACNAKKNNKKIIKKMKFKTNLAFDEKTVNMLCKNRTN